MPFASFIAKYIEKNLNTRGVLAEKLGKGVRPASQNPYPIYDQNLRFSLPYLWPKQKFDTLFMTWPLNQYPCLLYTSPSPRD